MDKNWKVIFAFAGVFLTGAITGVSISSLWYIRAKANKPDQGKPGFEQFVRNQFASTARKLDLSEEQHEKLKPSILKASEAFRNVRRHEHDESVKILEEFHGELKLILTPEQQQRFEKIRSQQREKIQRFIRQQPRQPREGEPHPHPHTQPEHNGDASTGTPPPPPPAQAPQPAPPPANP